MDVYKPDIIELFNAFDLIAHPARVGRSVERHIKEDKYGGLNSSKR